MARPNPSPGAPRLLLLDGGERRDPVWEGLLRSGGDGFELVRCPSLGAALDRLDPEWRGGRPPDAVVIGSGQPRPLGAAREIRDRDRSVQIVFLLPSDRLARFDEALLFSPQIRDAWTLAADARPGEARALLREAAEATRRRRAMRTALDRINIEIERARAPDTREVRRRAVSESYLAGLLVYAPDAILSVGADDRVLSWNDAAARLFGWGSDEALGRRLDELFPPGRRRELAGLLARARGGDPVFQYQIPLLRAGGGELEGEITVALVRDEAGDPLGVVVIARDVTERVIQQRELEDTTRELEMAVDELNRRTEEAEAAARAKSEFLAAMSHELRTPLQAIIGYAGLLEAGIGGELSERQMSHLLRIRASADHLLGLIDQVLDISRSDMGRLSLDLAVLDLCALVQEAVDLLRPQAEAKGLTLRCGPCGGEALRALRGDAGRIRQIVLNLLSNAVKFTERGGVSVGLELRPGPPPEAAVRVADTGAGLTEDEVRRVFEPFYQARTEPARRAPGMGLGLAISRRLAEAMGGRIEVESVAGAGSTFTLVLPAG